MVVKKDLYLILITLSAGVNKRLDAQETGGCLQAKMGTISGRVTNINNVKNKS